MEPNTAAPPATCDVAVVGAGILGLAVGRELSARRPGAGVVVLERREGVGLEQTGRNSGVIHAGVYYAPGSLKARLCVAGARALYGYCDEHGVPYERCGKLIVARDALESARLGELERRGRANGVPGLRRLGAGELREVEPHVHGVEALHSPASGIVDFRAVATAIAAELRGSGASVATSCGVERVAQRERRIVLSHARGETRARFAVFCAGLASDRLAVAAGAPADPRIVPFRGAYRFLRSGRRTLVRGLVYPVPDPALPFLGVHLTRHIDGEVSLGPSALLWPRGPHELAWPGTWRLARRFWRTGLRELRLAASRRAFAAEASSYVPQLEAGDLREGFAGIRAQALGRDGRLVEDFVVSRTERALHVRNAPSPAATSALALARVIADEVDSLDPP